MHTDKGDEHDSDVIPPGYSSVIGWDPRKKEEPKAEPPMSRSWEIRHAPSAFEPRTANAAMRDVKKKDLKPRPLFLDLWHEGELLVLAGPPHSGKTTLAVQLAEQIALGTQAPLPATPQSGVPSPTTDNRQPATVLLLDLENSDADFTRRYSVEDAKGRITKYKFAEKTFIRPEIDFTNIPSVFRGDKAHWIRHSFERILAETNPQVIIIDNLTLLDPEARPAKLLTWMRDLRHQAQRYGISILVTLPLLESPPARGGLDPDDRVGRRGGGNPPLTLTRADQRITSPADVILALNHSTFSESHRYLKVLKAKKSSPTYQGGVAVPTPSVGADGVVLSDSEQVLVYEITRSQTPFTTEPTDPAGPQAASLQTPHSGVKNSPPCSVVGDTHNTGKSFLPERGVSRCTSSGRGDSSEEMALADHSQLSTLNSQLDLFLGFTYIGTSPEIDHLTDHTIETLINRRLRLIRHLVKQGLPISFIEALVGPDPEKPKSDNIIQAIMSGDYLKYLNK